MNGTIKFKTLVCVFAVGLVSCFLGMNLLSSKPEREENEPARNRNLRISPLIPYSGAFKKSDLVVIASAYQTRDTKDKFSRSKGTTEDYLIGQETKFQTAVVLKGDKKIKEFSLLHFRLKPGTRIINGPRLVKFKLIEKEKHSIYMNSGGGDELLLFLKKRKDGRYEVTFLPYDPADTIKKITSMKFEF